VLSLLPAANRRKKHLIGVSGGHDSVALLHILAEAGWANLVVCHLDHGLRGAKSRGDSAFVRKLAERLGYPCETAVARTKARAREKSESLELAARTLRHEFFAECAKRHRCFRLILAHHADDQVETILFNFLRGTGAAGLAGMETIGALGKFAVFRPMLEVSRRQISAYATEHRIRFREDASNASLLHTRNRIRHTLIPAIEASVGPSFHAALRRAARIFGEEHALLESLLPPEGAEMSCAELRALPLALRRRATLRWLRSHEITDAGFAEVERVLSLLDPASGPAKINLPGNLHARRRQGKIFIE
jgi:tRNA(Ile)-lysidine synthase